MLKLIIASFVVVNILAISRVRVVSETERYACYSVDGRFLKFIGPGIQFHWPASGVWLRVRVGDVGQVVAENVARFSNQDLPICPANAKTGDAVTVIGFDTIGLKVEPERPRTH